MEDHTSRNTWVLQIEHGGWQKERRTQIWAVRERERDLGGSEVGVTMIKL